MFLTDQNGSLPALLRADETKEGEVEADLNQCKETGFDFWCFLKFATTDPSFLIYDWWEQTNNHENIQYYYRQDHKGDKKKAFFHIMWSGLKRKDGKKNQTWKTYNRQTNAEYLSLEDGTKRRYGQQ